MNTRPEVTEDLRAGSLLRQFYEFIKTGFIFNLKSNFGLDFKKSFRPNLAYLQKYDSHINLFLE